MISILIPVFNHPVQSLVNDLKNQCESLRIPFEIICFDDFSDQRYREQNRIISEWVGVSYIEMWENMGRAKIRNMLAKNARYEFLLFLDCDSTLHSSGQIKTYLEKCDSDSVLCGGRNVQETAPQNATKNLHWHYSRKREVKNPQYRNRRAVLYFHSNNFFAPRQVLLQFPFEEEIRQYGYEDLIFAHNLTKAGIRIRHIDNPVVHDGLVPYFEFIEKQKTSIHVLAKYINKNTLPPTKLTRSYSILQRVQLTDAFYRNMSIREKKFEKKLKSENPCLIYLDLLKLFWLIKSVRTESKHFLKK